MSDNIAITKIGGETGLSTVLNSGIVGSKLGGTLGLIKNENSALSFSSDGVTFTPLNSGGGEVDESRLLPDPSKLSSNSEGNVVAVTKLAADVNTIRLMHFNADFSDSVTGDSPVSTTNVSLQEPGKFGKSLHFDGNPPSDFYYPALSSSPDKWTIDFWTYPTQYMDSRAVLFLFGTVHNEEDIALLRVNNTGIYVEVGYHNSVISGGNPVSLNEWHHIALTYSDNTYKCYLDGNLYASQSSERKVYFAKKLWLGSYFAENGDHTMHGMIDEFRISNIVRWASNFTPPDKEYVGGEFSYTTISSEKLVDESRLLPETGSVSSDSVGNPVIFKAASRIDNTYWLCLPLNEDTNDRSTYGINTEAYGTVNIVSNAPSSPGGSAFFNGSSCLYGTLPAQFGTADFTVRFWMMAPEISGSSYPSTIFSTRQGELTSGDAVALHGTENGKLFIYSNTYITSNTDVPSVLKAGTWHHIAVVRKSGVATLYVDGNVYASGSLTNSLTRQAFSLGALWDGSNCTATGTFYMASLDVLNYAAYDGAFTVPSYQPGILTGMGYAVATDNELKGMLSVAGIDESRLLPETPKDGDVPVFNATATTGGGNDETVKLLIQPSTSGNQIVDSAAGNVVPVSLSIEGDITVSKEGIMQFTRSQTISVPMAFSTVEMITGNSEWCLDFEFIPPTDLNDDNEFWSLYNDEQSYVGFWRGSMGDIVHMPCFGDIPGFTRGEKHLLTFEQWKDGETWKLSGYHNGSIAKTSNVLIPATTSVDISFGHGNKRKFKGQIVSIRFRNIAPYRGTSFQPDATPYTVPQVVGAWANQNLNEQIDSKIATHNTSTGAHPAHYLTGADYNTITETGEYYVSPGSGAANAPDGSSYMLYVATYAESSWARIFQTATRYVTQLSQTRTFSRIGSRASVGGEVTWTDWEIVSKNIGIPNYGAGVDITSTLQQGVYAAPSAGWIYATAKGVSISENLIGDVTKIVLPVAAGDTITADMVTIAKFYPNR